MLAENPPKPAAASFMGCQKGKSSTMLYEQFGEVKYKYQNREVWWRGILCRHGRQKHKAETGVHTKSAERR